MYVVRFDTLRHHIETLIPSQRNIFRAEDAFGRRVMVKLIRRGRELDILKRLKSIPRSTPGNHTVPIEYIFDFGSSHALIAMPRYCVLGELDNLTQKAYYQLRYQLAHVRNI